MDELPVRQVGVILFPGFTVLDVYGPVQAFAVASARQADGSYHRFFKIVTVASSAGPVASAEGPTTLADYSFADLPPCDLLLIPGGLGTRRLVEDQPFLEMLAAASRTSAMTTTVCTGAALLARTGLLDDRQATSNKLAWDWVKEQGEKVSWIRNARWVDDGDIVTSSGVSAGIDMALAVVARLHGQETAENAARFMEYIWNQDPAKDPFS